MTATLVTSIGRLVTLDGPAAPVRHGASLALDAGRVAWVGDAGDRPPAELAARVAEEVDAGGRLVTPGLIDAHTHPLYDRPRFEEIVARSEGRSYQELGETGGIAATVRSTRAAGTERLERAVRARLGAWLRHGVTTVEVKTGYHLERDGELDAVACLDRLRGASGLPDLSVTLLAAHALPPEAAGDWDDYADEAAGWAAAARGRGADSCDVFCDEGYFTVEQSRRVLLTGAEAGLVPRVHADELAHTGGALLAAEVGAASADHLLWLTPADARALAGAGVVATLCPTTAVAVGRLPDVGALREAGATVALASDHNPGLGGTTDLTQVIALAVTALGLSLPEALRAVTVGAARALRLDDRGSIRVGARADVVVWDAEHEGAFAWQWGVEPVQVWRGGDHVVAPPGQPEA